MTSLAVDTDAVVPMSDGTKLAATVVRPSGAGRWPAVVMRTPYDRTTAASVSLQVHALALAAAGYGVVLQDVRGRGASEGAFAPFVDEMADGVDTIHWIADQPWCNGAVGSAGISYNAFAQLAAAVAAPEPLRAWVPGLAPCDVRTSWIRRGGALDVGFHLAWGLGAIAPADRSTRSPDALLAAYADPARTGRRLPQNQPELAATPAGRWYFDWLEHADPYAGDRRVPDRGAVGGVHAPALVIGGWFDVFAAGTAELLAALRSGAAAGAHRFVGGPWDHSGLPLGRRAGDRDFGPDAAADLHSLQLAWFDQHLRGGDEVVVDRVFTTGKNVWTTEIAWPPPTSSLVLHLAGDGRLPGAAPATGEFTVALDPADPTPGPGGAVFPWDPVLRCGAFDQRVRRERADVIAFSGDPLPEPMLVAGRPTCRLRVEAEVGASVVVTLSEATAAGPVWNVADGMARVDVLGGDVVVELGPLAHEFAAGSSVGLDVAFAADVRLPPVSRPAARTLHVGDGSSSLSLPVVA